MSNSEQQELLDQLYARLRERIEASARGEAPSHSYTASLIEKGEHHRTRKLLEEAAETAMAGLAESPARLAEESADLLYHLTLLWAVREVPPAQVLEVLRARLAVGEEKANSEPTNKEEAQ